MSSSSRGGNLENLQQNLQNTSDDSSDSDNSDLLNSNLEERTFRNILSILVGRQSMESLTLPGPHQHETTSDSDSDAGDNQFWKQSRPNLDTGKEEAEGGMRSSSQNLAEIQSITRSELGLSPWPQSHRVKIFDLLDRRSLTGPFSARSKRLIGGFFLPHNPTQVARYVLGGVQRNQFL